ncbi:replication protein A 70 kDa DNA-binding subunit A-like [Lolium rigidum]|uniref:replication protein A 70 kDa DNA-binding subunit A-like n=1 Tax=Lolium rigidum TaxID=89674 RepID=UPI001F5DC1FC|nr:replication protein A 70 kDa DNA-binding subunit A-like [Lolium rigidum]
MAAVRLTPNGVPAGLDGDLNLRPILQVVNLRCVNVDGGPGAARADRWRGLVSDGNETCPAMFAAQLSGLTRSGVIRRGTVVQLDEYVVNVVGGRRVFVVLNMTVLVAECDIIGNPVITETEFSTQTPQRVEQSNGTRQYGSMAGNPSPIRSNGNVPVFQPSMSENSLNTPTRLGNKPPAFQPTAQPSYRPAPSYKNHGAIAKNEAPARIIPISSLNPYQGRWAIKGRVTAKGDIRRYHNAKGEGKVFSFDLLDSDGGEIRVACFNALLDRFYEVVEVGKVYVVSRGNLKPAQKNFNHLNSEWEIMLENGSTVELCPDEDRSIPSQRFDFRPISEIEDTPTTNMVDIIGVVTSVSTCTTLQKKNGTETQKRNINLKDMSGRSVDVTMWGDFCNREGSKLQEMVERGVFPVLAVKTGRVTDFNGKSVGTISSSQLLIDPDISEAHTLRQWFDAGGRDASTQSISRDVAPAASRNVVRMTVAQIKDEGLGMQDKPDWVTVKASIIFFKSDSFCYTACPTKEGDRQCNKKVTKGTSGLWCCDRCDKEFPECDYRYLLQLQIQDHSGTAWVTAFQEAAQELLGCSAGDLNRYKEEEDPRFAETMVSCLFQDYLLRLKVKEETYGDERRVKNTLVKVERFDPAGESKYLLDSISRSVGY